MGIGLNRSFVICVQCGGSYASCLGVCYVGPYFKIMQAGLFAADGLQLPCRVVMLSQCWGYVTTSPPLSSRGTLEGPASITAAHFKRCIYRVPCLFGATKLEACITRGEPCSLSKVAISGSYKKAAGHGKLTPPPPTSPAGANILYLKFDQEYW